MLEKPDIPEARIAAHLRADYGLSIAEVDFLPLGADQNTAVYRAIAGWGESYFVKLRSGPFDEMTLRVPAILVTQGASVIAPLLTLSQQLWVDLQGFRLAVFPYIEWRDGYQADLLDRHWVEFGRALKAIHTAKLPPDLLGRIQHENYSDQWRERVREFQAHVEQTAFTDPVSAELAAFLIAKRAEIDGLVSRAADLAATLRPQPQPLSLCHADIHAGNILIGAASQLYIVDWDTLTLAPRERDLMFVGGGLFANRRSPQAEEELFYQGYGDVRIDNRTLAYYRCERIVQDIAAFCEQILLTDGPGQDRAQGLRFLTSQFEPGNVVEIAFNT